MNLKARAVTYWLARGWLSLLAGVFVVGVGTVVWSDPWGAFRPAAFIAFILVTYLAGMRLIHGR